MIAHRILHDIEEGVPENSLRAIARAADAYPIATECLWPAQLTRNFNHRTEDTS